MKTSILVFTSSWQTVSLSLLFLQTVCVNLFRIPHIAPFTQGGELPPRFSLKAASPASTVLELSFLYCYQVPAPTRSLMML